MNTEKSESTTRDRILDAAEQIFAERGFEGASMRNITARAKVNLSVIYYYFKSKEDLLFAVFQKYIQPRIDQQVVMLKEAREAAGTKPIPLRTLVEAAVLPRIEQVSSRVHQLVAMLIAHRQDFEKTVFSSLNALVQAPRKLFLEEFSKTCPDLPQEEVYFRLASLNALLNGFQALEPFMKDSSIKISRKTGVELLIKELVVLFSAPPSLPKEAN